MPLPLFPANVRPHPSCYAGMGAMGGGMPMGGGMVGGMR